MAEPPHRDDGLDIKDQQMALLNKSNTVLLRRIDEVLAESNSMQMDKMAVLQENSKLRDENFDLQNRVRHADMRCKENEEANVQKAKQLTEVTSQNQELLRMLQEEESKSQQLEMEAQTSSDELDTLKDKWQNMVDTVSNLEKMAADSAKEAQLKTEELRIRNDEVQQLRTANQNATRQAQIENESLQDQIHSNKLRLNTLMVRADDAERDRDLALQQSNQMEASMRQMQARNTEIETQLQVEIRAKRSQMEANKELFQSEETLRNQISDLQNKLEQTEQEKSRITAEARDASEQLRGQSESIFQLLERNKLAESAKNQTIDSLKRKEKQLNDLQNKINRLVKEANKEGRARTKAELDSKALSEQIKVLKRTNAQLTTRLKQEVETGMKLHEANGANEDNIKTLSGRLQFLMNKIQADEEIKVTQREELKKFEAQVTALGESNDEIRKDAKSKEQSNRLLQDALRLKQMELDQQTTRFEVLKENITKAGGNIKALLAGKFVPGEALNMGQAAALEETRDLSKYNDNDTDAVKASGGAGRYTLDAKPQLGLVLIKAIRKTSKPLLDRLKINSFLRHSQEKSVHDLKQRLIKKMCDLLGLLQASEEEILMLKDEMTDKTKDNEALMQKNTYVQKQFNDEETAKRSVMLKYVAMCKTAVLAKYRAAQLSGEASSGGGVLALSNSGIGNEEMYALCAQLNKDEDGVVSSLELRENSISDEGVRALCSVVSSASNRISHIDLRKNQITENGIKALSDALDRCQAVRHVYTQQDGVIKALGVMSGVREDANGTMSADLGTQNIAVQEICVVDCRENNRLGTAQRVNVSQSMKFTKRSHRAQTPDGNTLRKSKLHSKRPYSGSQQHPIGREAWKSQPLNEDDRNELNYVTKAEQEKAQKRRIAKQRKRMQKQKREDGWNGRCGGYENTVLAKTGQIDNNNDMNATTPINEQSNLPPLSSTAAPQGLRKRNFNSSSSPNFARNSGMQPGGLSRTIR
eukprot:TRINITY_DN3859_c0_g1_i10.p1 TRINITY_DN3859_c0_g1~~TRINITY_DN3859_c0_g1_i10.p1  ORF type:complete len:988 (-),score=375.46 TRINITY_DN3859_c0_g1_i10:2927-5890(-)